MSPVNSCRAVFGCDEIVAEYIRQGTGATFTPPFVTIGFLRDDKLCFGALYNGWNGSNIEVSVFGPGAVSKLIVGTVLRYPFRQLNANRLTAKTKRSNKPMQRFLPRLGFSFEGIQKRYFGQHKADDALLYALFPESAEKWIK